MKRFLGVFFGAFAFLVLGDSASLRGQNPPGQQIPDYLCEPMKGYDSAMCLSAADGDPQGPLGSRIPVILIHGWNPKEIAGEPDLSVWEGLGRYFYESRWFREHYKMYFLVYLSNVQGWTLRDMGLTFRSLIDRVDDVDSAFRGKPLVLIGHSMGGLVARSYMQEFRRGSSRRNGDRILRLITLGTPHHGSPFANGPARDSKVGGIWAELLHQFVDGGLFGVDIRWDMDNRYDLHWDNYDGLFDYERFPENSLWMEWLNSGDTFEGKIVAYGGKLRTLDKLEDCFGWFGLVSLACLATIMNRALGVSESDGFVPLSSALFEPCENCVVARIFPGYDHSEIARGKFHIYGDPEPLFDNIANDLLSVMVPHSSGFDSYVDLGNPVDERFHNLEGWGGVNPGLLPYPDTDRTSRYQLFRSSNSVDLFVSQLNVPYRLTFRSEDGHCDDSFDVYVSNRLIYRYTHRGPPTDFPIHNVSVPAELVTSSRVRVVFQNLARDNCGLAAIYYVRLDPL